MSDESEALSADELIDQLKGTGLFEKYNHQAVMGACIFMISRSIHMEMKFPATTCLTVIEKVASTMLQQEHQNGMLQALLNTEGAPS